MANVGRVLIVGPALFICCAKTPPKVVPENPVIVEEVRLEGFDVLPVDVREDLPGDLPLRAGIALTEDVEKAGGERAVEILQNHGYPYAQVGIAREPIDSSRTRVIVRADPGTVGFFGPVDIAGNRRVDDRIIRRRLAYAPGDLFRRGAIEQTQQRIGAIGLFKSVEIRVLNIDNRPAVVPTLITVEEDTPWKWNLGLGYAAGDRLGVDARISHLNVFGAAERIDLQGRVSKIERTAELSYTQTDAWHPALSLALQARHQEIDERAFFVMSRGGQAAVGWQWTDEFSTTGSYAVSLERSDVDAALDPLLGLRDGMLSAWALDLEHRRLAASAAGFGESRRSAQDADAQRRDTPVRTMSLHVEQAGGWMPGTFNYFSVAGDARHYLRAFDERVVFASRLRLGSIDPMGGDADVPLLKRFFLGGSNDMRAWGTYELSPLSASGEPVGGKSLLTATAEVRVPLLKRLRGAVFVEAGNVWLDPWTMRLGDLRYDIGPGLRFDTPFGLLRVDFGYQLRPLDGLRLDGKPQTSRWRINFGIGEAF
jgi:translocation and assembly module TamA